MIKKNLPLRILFFLFLVAIFLGPILVLFAPSVALAAELTNPLKVGSIPEFIGNVILALLGLSGSIALLMFVWGGMQWLISGGSAERVKKGKDTIIWAVLGLVVIFTAYTLVSVVVKALAGDSII